MTELNMEKTVARKVVVNETLCFLTTKLSRFPLKQIKSLMFDFYSVDTIASAKETLIADASALETEDLRKSCRNRRDSKENPERKVRLDIEDMVSVVTLLDEKKVLDQLPLYVAANTDLVPSPRLVEGDMMAVLCKLEKMDDRLESMQLELEETRAQLNRQVIACCCKGNAKAGKAMDKAAVKAGQLLVGGGRKRGRMDITSRSTRSPVGIGGGIKCTRI